MKEEIQKAIVELIQSGREVAPILADEIITKGLLLNYYAIGLALILAVVSFIFFKVSCAVKIKDDSYFKNQNLPFVVVTWISGLLSIIIIAVSIGSIITIKVAPHMYIIKQFLPGGRS